MSGSVIIIKGNISRTRHAVKLSTYDQRTLAS